MKHASVQRRVLYTSGTDWAFNASMFVRQHNHESVNPTLGINKMKVFKLYKVATHPNGRGLLPPLNLLLN